MKEKRKACFGTGAPSIIVTFVILCLTALAALSLTTANSDFRLAEKSAQYTAAYYEADAAAERFLAEAEANLKKGVRPEETTVLFPVTQGQSLRLSFQVEGGRCVETSRRLVMTETWDYEDSAH